MKNEKQKVNIIPATRRHMQSGDQFRKQEKLRVAAYCRVSTEEESQQNSYAVQKRNYTTLILSRSGWEMAGIYADEGKSGTSRKNRVHFNQMMQDAKNGKMDYIITKSISRFARNTADALDCVHELQRLHPPVGIFFERENIDTLNSSSEMFLTFYCSMAQEESRSISENIRWAIQKNFASGKPQINLRRMLGYDPCRDGSWIINEDQAVTVCYIYGRFLQGTSANAIAKELNESGRFTVNGCMWRADSVLNILRNEKYVGDLMMQKTYTESFLTHKSVINNGEYKKYYLKDHHPAIIDRDTWNKVQQLLLHRASSGKKAFRTVETGAGTMEIGIKEELSESRRGAVKSPFDGLVCKCGEKMRRMTYNAAARGYSDERSLHARLQGEEAYVDTYTFSYAVWKCPKSFTKDPLINSKRCCDSLTLTEQAMEQAFMEMLYRIKKDYEQNGSDSEIMKSFGHSYDALCRKEVNNGFIEQKLDIMELEIKRMEVTYQNTLKKRDTAAYAVSLAIGGEMSKMTAGFTDNPYDQLVCDLKKRLEAKKAEYQKLSGNRSMAHQMKQNFDAFIKALSDLPTQNRAGIPWNINALDVDGSAFYTAGGKKKNKETINIKGISVTSNILQSAPDYLIFDEYIFRTFILKMTAHGDEIQYGTTFGLILTTIGNSRRMHNFRGYRIGKDNGTMEYITEGYQLAKGKIQHHWKKKKDYSRIRKE